MTGAPSPGSDPNPLHALRELDAGGEFVGAHPVQPHGVQEDLAPGASQSSLPTHWPTTSRPPGNRMSERGNVGKQEAQQPDTVCQKEEECKQGK